MEKINDCHLDDMIIKDKLSTPKKSIEKVTNKRVKTFNAVNHPTTAILENSRR
jgi:hypothetical protein